MLGPRPSQLPTWNVLLVCFIRKWTGINSCCAAKQSGSAAREADCVENLLQCDCTRRLCSKYLQSGSWWRSTEPEHEWWLVSVVSAVLGSVR